MLRTLFRSLGGIPGGGQGRIQTGGWFTYKLLSAAQLLKVYELPQLALLTHPDKNPDNEEATREFQKISEAYRRLATHLDESVHTHEYADQFDEYDNGYDDDDEGDFIIFDAEDLLFYLWVLFRPLFETCLQIPRSFMFEQMEGRGNKNFHMRNRNVLPVAHSIS